MACQTAYASMRLYDAVTQQNIFGNTPIEITSFTSNIGFNNSESSATIDLVVNQCVGGNIPNLNTGYAVQFICNGFAFGGIVKRIEYSESDAGVKYKVDIGDPRKLLDTVQLLLSNYYCRLQAPNFINVLNLIEGNAAGAACAGITSAGSLPSIGNCSVYGLSSSSTGRGVSYFKAISAINNAGVTLYTSAGTPLSINLSPIVSAASSIPYASTDGSSVSLLQLITSICEESGFDFVVTLIGQTINFILINRKNNPAFGNISSLIGQARSAGTLISSSQGLEETYEPTNKVVIGDKIQYLKLGTSTWAQNYTTMLLGYTNEGYPIRATQQNLSEGVFINTTTLNAGLGGIISNALKIKEAELLSLGSLPLWKAYSLKNPDSIGATVGRALLGSEWDNLVATALNAFTAIQGGLGNFSALQNVINNQVRNATVATLFDDVAYNWLKSFANEYYGKQWLVSLRQRICISAPYRSIPFFATEGGSTLLSDVPSDGGWPDSANILGLNYGAETSSFTLDDGRVGPFIVFNTNTITNKVWGNTNIVYYLNTGLLSGDFVTKNNLIYAPCSIDSKMFNGLDGSVELLVKTPLIPLSIRPTTAATVSNGLNALSALLGANLTNINDAQNKATINPSIFNILKDNPAAFTFNGICIPMRSNMYVYGPFTASSNSVGGTIVEEVPDLNPWTYGGLQQMTVVGRSLASTGLKGQNKSESGSITLAEAPAYSLGPVSSLGGLVLGSLTTNFGSSGVTTTYNFQTFTPKFGNYSQALANTVKQNLENRKIIYKNIKEFNLKFINSINNARTLIVKNTWNLRSPSDIIRTNQSSSASQNSPNILLYSSYLLRGDIDVQAASGSGGGPMGSVFQNPLSCKEVCDGDRPSGLDYSSSGSANNKRIYSLSGFEKTDGIDQFLDSARYGAYSILSLDSIFAPVSLRGSGSLPRMIHSNIDQNKQLSKSRGSMPPIWLGSNIVGNLPITQQYLNPMLSLANLNSWDGRQGGGGVGFTISHISYGSDPSKLFQLDDSERQQQTDFRFAALKGPLVLQSWGYDTNGKPIPNKSDSPANCENGSFNKTGLYDQFMPNWLANPKTWPVGPIDLRWDRDRGVWVAPPPEKIVVAQLLQDLNPGGAAEAILLNPGGGLGLFFDEYDVYGPNGEHISGNIGSASIMVGDFLGRKLCKGTRIYAYHYDNGRYIALEASIVNEETCECECTTSPTTTTPTTTTPTPSTPTPSTPPTPPTPTPPTPPTPTLPTFTLPTETPTFTLPTFTLPTETPTFTLPTETPTFTLPTETPTVPTPPCDVCDLYDCLSQLGGDGVLGISGGCLKIYPLTTCPSEN